MPLFSFYHNQKDIKVSWLSLSIYLEYGTKQTRPVYIQVYNLSQPLSGNVLICVINEGTFSGIPHWFFLIFLNFVYINSVIPWSQSFWWQMEWWVYRGFPVDENFSLKFSEPMFIPYSDFAIGHSKFSWKIVLNVQNKQAFKLSFLKFPGSWFSCLLCFQELKIIVHLF